MRQSLESAGPEAAPLVGVAIIDSDWVVREGLAFLIRSDPGFVLDGTYACMKEAVPVFERRPPGIALVGVGLPGRSGVDGIRRMAGWQMPFPIVVIGSDADADRVVEALAAGASGHLPPGTPPPELLRQLREMAAGRVAVSAAVLRRMVALLNVSAEPQAGSAQQLTPYESRVLRLMAEGHNYKSAARELGCSAHTVNFHARSIYGKLDVHTRADAVARALRDGLIR